MKSSKTIALTALAAATLLGVSACSGGGSGSGDGGGDAAAKDVSIGFLNNQTGTASGPFGLPFAKGFELAMAEIEESGFLDGTGYALKVEKTDIASDLTTAITAYNKFVNGGVDLVLTDSMTPTTAGITPMANEDGVLFLSGAGGGTGSENEDGFAFHVADVLTPMETLGQYLADTGVENFVAVIDGDNPTFQAMAAGAEKGFQAAGQPGFSSVESVVEADSDFGPLLTKLRAAEPDAVILSVMPAQAGNILRQMSTFGGLEDVIDVGTGAWSTQVFDVGQEAAVGALFALPWAPGLPESAKFEEGYAAEYGEAPNAYSGLGYQTAWLIATAVKDIADSGGEVDSIALRDAIPSASTSDTLAEHGLIDDFSLSAESGPRYPGVLSTFAEDGSMVAYQAE